MSSYKVPFDFTHEEKVFRWLFIIKTDVVYNFNCNIGWNTVFTYFNGCKNDNFYSCFKSIFDICFFENRQSIC